jgi:hypothetical protein
MWGRANDSDEENEDDEASAGEERAPRGKSSLDSQNTNDSPPLKKNVNVSGRASQSGKLVDLEKELKRRSKLIDRELKKSDKIFKSTIKLLLLGTGESGKSTILKQMRIIHASKFTYKEKVEIIYDIKSNIRDSILSILEAMERFNVAFENERLVEAREYVYENIHLFTLNNISTAIDQNNNPQQQKTRQTSTNHHNSTNHQSSNNSHSNTRLSSSATLNVSNSMNTNASNNSFRSECGCESQEELNEKLDRLWQCIEAMWADAGAKRCAKRGNEFHLIDSAEYFLDRLAIIKQLDYLPNEQDILR